ncbi:hypothetical protein HRG_014410 [Hirsutella rhossiliensis]
MRKRAVLDGSFIDQAPRDQRRALFSFQHNHYDPYHDLISDSDHLITWLQSTVYDLRLITNTTPCCICQHKPLDRFIPWEYHRSETWKRQLVDDFAKRTLPYRKWYLFYGPPGTGKSSFSLSVASEFDLDIYVVNISMRRSPDPELSKYRRLAKGGTSPPPVRHFHRLEESPGLLLLG